MTGAKTPGVHKLDPTFGPRKNGLTWFKFPEHENGSAEGITVAPDGKLLIAGHVGNKFSIVRLNANGKQDTSFSKDGVASGIFAPGYRSFGGSVTILGNKNLLLDGFFYLHEKAQAQRGLAMFRSDGTPDTRFGDDGVKLVDPIPLPVLIPPDMQPRQNRTTAADLSGRSIELDNGKLMVLSNHRYSVNDQCGLLIRLQSNGDLDTTFGKGKGYVAIRYLANFTWTGPMIRLHDGRFAIAGNVSGNFGYRAMIALFSAEGEPVLEFGDKGYALFDDLDTFSQINALVEMPDGNIVGIGSATDESYVSKGVLVCVNRKGDFVQGFNQGKPVQTSWPNARYGIQWTSGKLRDGGRIIVLASTHGEENSEIVIAQFKSDGRPDDFADNGVLVINLTNVLDMGESIALQNNRIVVSGTSLPYPDGVRSFAFRCADTF